ncbi:expressed protein [Echinococcus multilocularis]|uniref:Expressed protein n=1 Tax=Echinococcus multilocularis TaxID=6211 RepID=A0A068YJV0_ECHMU|nr:expressed protein [Echinococcus multilocularis]
MLRLTNESKHQEPPKPKLSRYSRSITQTSKTKSPITLVATPRKAAALPCILIGVARGKGEGEEIEGDRGPSQSIHRTVDRFARVTLSQARRERRIGERSERRK